MSTLGGSLAQVLIPIVCAVAFLRTHRDLFGAEQSAGALPMAASLVWAAVIAGRRTATV
jgi:hypothetical protein